MIIVIQLDTAKNKIEHEIDRNVEYKSFICFFVI